MSLLTCFFSFQEELSSFFYGSQKLQRLGTKLPLSPNCTPYYKPA
jgi:hypothetical protein